MIKPLGPCQKQINGHLFGVRKQVRLWPIPSGATDSLARELNNDHGAVDGYPQDMFIDYYNTYTPGTYNLQDVIDKLNAEETSDSIRSLSGTSLIQQLKWKRKGGWIYSTKTRPSYEIVSGESWRNGDTTDGESFTGWMGDREDSVDDNDIQGTSIHTDVLSWNVTTRTTKVEPIRNTFYVSTALNSLKS